VLFLRDVNRARLAEARTPKGRREADDRRRATWDAAVALGRKRELEEIRIGTTVGH